MQKVKAVIAYDGSAYLGFQKQKSTKKTVTYAIEEALSSLQITSLIVASGRTDAGVHATGQVIHFELPSFWTDLHKLKINLNRKLIDIEFKHISVVPQNFHARFSAQKRQYRYLFKTNKPSVFEQKYISYYPASFQSEKLQEALNSFIGTYDFQYFCKTGSTPHSTIRTVYKTKYYTHNRDLHIIMFQANGFLRSQVRMMIAAAMQYAQGEITLHTLQMQVKHEKKSQSSLASPEGLYLAKIIY